jgi:hypothetical protein
VGAAHDLVGRQCAIGFGSGRSSDVTIILCHLAECLKFRELAQEFYVDALGRRGQRLAAPLGDAEMGAPG